VYVLLEFQSGVHPFMAARVLTYVDLLYQELIRARQWVRDAPGSRGRRLPPVAPIVLYNGRRRWRAATELADLIAPGPPGLAVYQPRLRYVLIEERAYAAAEGSMSRNLVAALFQLEFSRDPESARQVVTALAAWLTEAEQAELRRSFVLWLREAFFRTRLPGMEFPELHDLEEVRTMLTEQVVDWTRQWKQAGRLEGRQEGEVLLLRRLLMRRFGALPTWAEERLAQASTEQVETWGDRVLEAASLTEVLGSPGA
jgi:hypothetical protein